MKSKEIGCPGGARAPCGPPKSATDSETKTMLLTRPLRPKIGATPEGLSDPPLETFEVYFLLSA